MKIFRYWAKASAPAKEGNAEFSIDCYGGSNRSMDDALQVARQRADAAAKRLASNRSLNGSHDDYGYPNGYLREEIKNELQNDGETVALITRNAAGCLVLNTANIFFADIDYVKAPEPSMFSKVLSMFSGEQPATADEKVVENVRQVSEANSNLGMRLYRTHNGFRCMVTSRTFEPKSMETQTLLTDLNSDPLYMQLCKAQECFRARLSPKPFRCGIDRPSNPFPFRDVSAEARHRKWEEKYEKTSSAYSTCMLIGEFGTTSMPSEVASILQVHDQLACGGSGPLA